MPFLNTFLGEFTGSIHSSSYLNEQDTELFYTTQSVDMWFGSSANDVIEISAFDVNNNELTHWGRIHEDKSYSTTNVSYVDSLNNKQFFSYKELATNFTQFKKEKILLDPINDLQSIGITDGTINLLYKFTRDMAGSEKYPLLIKEVSPSRQEIKLIPTGKSDITYSSFCLKKFPIKDISSIILPIVKKCPYDQIYRDLFSKYKSEIEFLKVIFFLVDDASVITFLKNLYEDYVRYTFLSESQLDAGNEPTRISRTQGISTYFTNYILQNYETMIDFESLEQKFASFVNFRISEIFEQYKNQKSVQHTNVKSFVYEFFVTHFYKSAVDPLKNAYNEKYFSYFRNVLNFGNDKYFHILNHTVIDERQSLEDPLTLVVKISTELPINIGQKSTCWISNYSMVPFVTTIILRNPIKYKTLKIAPANFGSPSQFITSENVNKLYSSDDLELPESVNNDIILNKSEFSLNIDYSDFSNFVIFSSAAARLSVFKRKMIRWTELSSSVSTLSQIYTSSLASASVYPYYVEELESANAEISEIIGSFDGYEASLFNSKNYLYSIPRKSFINSSFVMEQDLAAADYDKSNRDSLVANTPQFILNDQNNEEYITFLTMAGHHFDNIYTYISALPIERQVKNELSSSLPTNTLKEMLYSFGWNIDDIVGNLNIDEVYLNSTNASTYNALSGEERLKTIWNRILVTLPGIYKTKGTEECVRYLMSCYGLPSSMISIREYGGSDYSDTAEPTYTLDEKTYMLAFSGTNDYVEGPMPSSAKTVEFKFSTGTSSIDNHAYKTLFSNIPYPFTSSNNRAWSIGIRKLPGKYLGTVEFRMESGSMYDTIVTSSALPIFNGDIFSVMLRKTDRDINFESTSDDNCYPTVYDLNVQRNENGRRVFYSTSSVVMKYDYNRLFSQAGSFRLSDGTFEGTLDKLSIWDVAISDSDFEEHVNDINSYGYSGSNAYSNLIVRVSTDYPKSTYYNLNGSSSVWMDNKSPYYAIPNYYTDVRNLSSSIDTNLYSASLNIIQNRWSSIHPSGSVSIIARNFQDVKGSVSYASSSCSWISSSTYPFNYREFTYQQSIDASKYGPNRYKNKKARRLVYSLESRLDSQNRSTVEEDSSVSGESNQLGFFIDPQDSKNKDILRYVGKSGIMSLIADPSNVYSDRYYGLRNKNYEYHTVGNKQTLFNELMTIYKFYFDKSIFQTIKNIVPARSNVFTGIVIEPSLLERPKYQNRPITSSIFVSHQAPTIISNNYSISNQISWANFSTDWNRFTTESKNTILNSMPPNYQDTIDLTKVSKPLKIYSNNLFFGNVVDSMDVIQNCVYPDYENLSRGWEPLTSCRGGIYGSVSRKNPGDIPTIDNHHVPVGIDETQNVADNKHQILYYMLKVWEKFNYYFKSGDYVRSDNPVDNTHDSASVYLYKYVMVDERFMNENVHFSDGIATSVRPEDPSYSINDSNHYIHRANTFKNTPDQIFSNVSSSFTSGNPYINPYSFDIVLKPTDKYFELSIGYPRNHMTHKSCQFSKTKFFRNNGSIYVKGRQTNDTTINLSGIDDGSSPVQSFNVSNVNVRNSNNIIHQLTLDT